MLTEEDLRSTAGAMMPGACALGAKPMGFGKDFLVLVVVFSLLVVSGNKRRGATATGYRGGVCGIGRDTILGGRGGRS